VINGDWSGLCASSLTFASTMLDVEFSFSPNCRLAGGPFEKLPQKACRGGWALGELIDEVNRRKLIKHGTHSTFHRTPLDLLAGITPLLRRLCFSKEYKTTKLERRKGCEPKAWEGKDVCRLNAKSSCAPWGQYLL
jgi:hypothetical protein